VTIPSLERMEDTSKFVFVCITPVASAARALRPTRRVGPTSTKEELLMLSLRALRTRDLVLACAASFSLVVTAACSDGKGDAGSNDSGVYDPPNPAGLGPAPVDLGGTTDAASIGSYAILAKTGITNVTGSAITGGSLGLSPAAASYVAGFALIADPSGVFSTSSSVVTPARIYASDYTSPTPSNLTTAVLAMQAAYSDAASRTNPDHLNLSSGNLGGLTLTPGLYTWGSGVTIPTHVTIAGGATDVWIFQISNDLDVTAAMSVLLSGGAQAKNIFWQVAGQATIHAGAHVEGIILSKTGITLQTGASLHGRAFAQTLVALDDNAITTP